MGGDIRKCFQDAVEAARESRRSMGRGAPTLANSEYGQQLVPMVRDLLQAYESSGEPPRGAVTVVHDTLRRVGVQNRSGSGPIGRTTVARLVKHVRAADAAE